MKPDIPEIPETPEAGSSLMIPTMYRETAKAKYIKKKKMNRTATILSANPSMRTILDIRNRSIK